MNEQRSSLQPAPRSMCAAHAPLLPLLSLGKLDPEEAAPVREHVATCEFCRGQLREFDALRDALRRHGVPAGGAEAAAAEPVPELTLATILDAVHGADHSADEEREGAFDLDFAETAAPSGPPPAHWPRVGRGRWTGIGALAAALLVSLLAGVLFGWHAGLLAGTPGGPAHLAPGTIRVFPLPPTGCGAPVKDSICGPWSIASGPDGNLWFAEGALNTIGRITPEGRVQEFALPPPCHGSSCFPIGITSGPDGNLWFTADTGNIIGQITPAGQIHAFALPTCGGGSCYPHGITLGPDGNLWFTEASGNKIGRITPAGQIQEFACASGCDGMGDITLGPDGNLWFTDLLGNRIGEIAPR